MTKFSGVPSYVRHAVTAPKKDGDKRWTSTCICGWRCWDSTPDRVEDLGTIHLNAYEDVNGDS